MTTMEVATVGKLFRSSN